MICLWKSVLFIFFAFVECVQSYSVFETNIDFEIRFMVDVQMTGCCWVEAPSNKYKLRKSAIQGVSSETLSQCTQLSGSNSMIGQSRCQIELDIAWDALVIHPAEGIWSEIAPLRILSFDIECASRKGDRKSVV